MSDLWPSEMLSTVVTLQRGFDLPQAQRQPGRYPVVTSSGINDQHDQFMVAGPGVVIGRAANIGRPTWVVSDHWPHNTTMFVKDYHGNDRRWVYWLFKSIDLAGYNSGSVQPMLNRNYIASFSVRVPPVPAQRAIAEVLGALDDKIAANERLVRLGDQLSMALYEQALGGGDHVELSSLATFVNGRAFTRGATGTGRLVVRIAELNNGPSASTIYNELDVAEEHLARPGDLLFAWSGSLAVRRWFRNEAIVNQHIFKVVPRGQPAWLIKMALLRELPNFKAIATGKATTMGHIQRKHLDVAVEIPAEDRVRRIDTAMTALSDLALSAERESLVVAELRDTLLPALMSGRIRVKDAEKTASEVV